MKKINDLKVVISASASNFEDSLKEQVNNMQRQELEVTINNPHLIDTSGTFNYIAVVEGRAEEASVSKHHKDHQTEGSKLTPFH